MSFDIIPEPVVKSPKTDELRVGRGFTKDELKQADLTVKEARDMGLIVDLRRKTFHEKNVEILKQYITDMEKLVSSLADEKTDSVDAVSTLSALRVVKKAEAEALVAAGIQSLSDLAYCDITKTANKTGIDEERITAMVKAALAKV